MHQARFTPAERRILEQYWKLGTCSVREILDSLPAEERVAYTTVQTLVYRLEQKRRPAQGQKDRQRPTIRARHRSA